MSGQDALPAYERQRAWAAEGERAPVSRLSVPLLLGPHPGLAVVMTDGTLTYALQPIDGHTTRMFMRERDAFSDNLLVRLVWDPTHFVMQRQMMRGIKARAEGHPEPHAALDLPARLGWAVAGIALLALFLAQGNGGSGCSCRLRR